MPRIADFTEPAFVMDKDDCFYKLIVSNPVLFELAHDAHTVLTFVAIHRTIGTFSITNIIKTFQKGVCVSRLVQDKNGITAKNIEKEMAKIQTDFTQGVQAQTNCETYWDALDLSKTTDRKEQCERIKIWGKLKVC
ncbi:MAG: hypothetical protein PHI84_01570 [Kiritimatiellae bacterium]|nr:hypothetical protein [Kiritimatiellia bacterium]